MTERESSKFNMFLQELERAARGICGKYPEDSYRAVGCVVSPNSRDEALAPRGAVVRDGTFRRGCRSQGWGLNLVGFGPIRERKRK